MSTVLMLYSRKTCREQLLPPLLDEDTVIFLDRRSFDLKKDLELKLENDAGDWYFGRSDTYLISDRGGNPAVDALRDGENYILTTSYGETISMIAAFRDTFFVTWKKYSLRDVDLVTIGRASDNMIQYSYRTAGQEFISRYMAEIHCGDRSATITDKGRNGIFVNGIRVVRPIELVFGDAIGIWGLRLVYLGDVLAVRTDVSCTVSEELPVWNREYSEVHGSPRPLVKELYHRAPRHMEDLDTGEMIIPQPPEAPQPKETDTGQERENNLSIYLFPMMGGSLLAIWSAACPEGILSAVMRWSAFGLILVSSLAVLTAFAAKKKKDRTAAYGGSMNASGDLPADRIELSPAERRYRDRVFAELKRRYDGNIISLRKMYPDVRELVTEKQILENTLWNRNRTHRDFLQYRMGTGSIPFQVSFRFPDFGYSGQNPDLFEDVRRMTDACRTLRDVPVLADFFEHRIVGLVGGVQKAGAYELVRVLMAGIASQNCYTDVKLCFAVKEEDDRPGSMVRTGRWLPHTWSPDRKKRYVACRTAECQELFYELTGILRERAESEETGPDHIWKPWYILFVEDRKLLEGEPILRYLLDSEINLGFTLLLMTEHQEELPNACEYILENDTLFQGIFHARTGQRTPVNFDMVDGNALDAFARRLSGIEVEETETGGEIPEMVDFLNLYEVKRPEELNAEERWRKNRTWRGLSAPIGRSLGGALLSLNVHEKYHGPHGLVAGTTGSGKTELLQTWILSMAVNYSPEDIAFFLIDYKGGSIAEMFRGLPHLMGELSNLSGPLAERAMISIKSEVRKRQRLFLRYRVNHIDSYNRLVKNGEVKETVPHLFLVVDEFSELRRREAKFLEELISVAQVGRSLGIHLILSTQKPSGNVDENIWSNARFHLCLRVQEKQDSLDVLHRTDAAAITQTGRCFMQVGSDEVCEVFQAGWSGVPWNDREKRKEASAELLANSGVMERPLMMAEERDAVPEDLQTTQLDAVKEYLIRTAEKTGARKPATLWLPELSRNLAREDLAGKEDASAPDGQNVPGEYTAAVGLFDDPENQRQPVFNLQLHNTGHLAVLGSAMSGKTTFLETLLLGLLRRYTAGQLQVYVLDFSGGRLREFASAPQVGGVLTEEDGKGPGRLFHMMEKEAARRRTLFTGGTFRQYAARQEGCPAILLVLDGADAFRDKTKQQYDEIMERLLREGGALGIWIIVSAGGYHSSGIPLRMKELFGTTVTLDLGDAYRYREIFEQADGVMMPEKMIPGRGLARDGGRVLTFQTAVAGGISEDYMRKDVIRREMEYVLKNADGMPAPEIPSIPDPLLFETVRTLPAFRQMCAAGILPVGFDEETAEPAGIPVSSLWTFLVQGSRRSGRRNFLKLIAEEAAEAGFRVAAAEPEGARFLSMAEAGTITRITDAEKFLDFAEKTLIPAFRRRTEIRMRLQTEGRSVEEIAAVMNQEEQLVLIVTDLARWFSWFYSSDMKERKLPGIMEEILEKGAGCRIAVFGAMLSEERQELGAYPAFTSFMRDIRGIHFGGHIFRQRTLNFSGMPVQEQNRAERPGIGVLSAVGDELPRRIITPIM